jgi:glycosyltransferase involved in cell wall biosynthesis
MGNNSTPKFIELLIPSHEVNTDPNPEISIVVPALNEEITIGEFVDWCWHGLKLAGVSGEVIIVDSSNDRTPDIALTKGARVLRTPKNGLGQAYLDSIPFIRGNFIIMGDCDLTYDFREVNRFIDSYHAGNEYVMGSRFKGSIEVGAMPPLHRYFGTPLTTWILNKIYKSKYSDIHCGMRGLTKDALRRIDLTSTGWEYASEMVLKASRVGLKIDEVPVTFYKDREGRFSHHRRAGFWSPWHAGWINLKVMLVYSPDSFLLGPGIFSMSTGALLATLSLLGNISIWKIGFGLYTLLLGTSAIILGYSLFQIGIISRAIHGLRNGMERRVLRGLTYDKGMATSFLLLVLGLIVEIFFIKTYIENNFSVVVGSKSAIFGLLMILLAVQTFSFTLMLELIRRKK